MTRADDQRRRVEQLRQLRLDSARHVVTEAGISTDTIAGAVADRIIAVLDEAGLLISQPHEAVIVAQAPPRELAPGERRRILPPGGARAVRKGLAGGEQRWTAPAEFGSDGWLLRSQRWESGTVLLLGFRWLNAETRDEDEWVQATLSWGKRPPTAADVQMLHRAVFGAGWAYVMYQPDHNEIAVQGNAVTLWGRADGMAGMPTFGTAAPIAREVEQ